ncbi:TPA: RHS repeat-associated core domain-containing protein, partial [Enterococcus faecium]|nr:RHS repeat-associated core domain-containing protein [Enterococcus faecium]
TSCPGAGSGNPNLPKCSKDDAGNGKSFEYDTAGNVTSTTDTTSGGTGAVTETYTYEKNNRSVCGGFEGQICSSKNGIGGVTSYAYDTSGNLLSVTPPAPMGKTVYEYDSLGRVTKVTDGNGDATSYTYSQRDDVLQTTFAGGATFNAEYYQNGTVHFQRDSTTGTKESFYDGLARLLRVTGPAAGTTQSYTYDKIGNVLSYTDAQGKVSYTYDAANQLTQLTEPGGTCTTATPAASSGCVKFAYDNNGAETKRTYPGGATMNITNDLATRPTRIVAKDKAGTVVYDVGYTYGSGGASTKAADRLNVQTRVSYKEVGITAGAITSYTYDSLKRLTSAVEKSGTTTTASWTYAYDKAGNRTTQTRAGSTGAAAGTTSYTYNTANQLTGSTGATATYQYDAVGNQKVNGANGQTASYNSRQAVTAIGSSNYVAFGQGNTDTQTRSASSTQYERSSIGLATETTSAGVSAFTRTNGGLAVALRGASTKSYFVFDAAGSVTGLFSADGSFQGGYSYSPYGESRAMTSGAAAVTNNPLRFTSGYWDSSVNLYKFGARFYDPSAGRFTQYDPTGQESNPYLYGNGDPIGFVDPSGTSAKGWSKGLSIASTAASIASLALTATGVGAPLAAGLTIASTALSVGSRAVVGDTRGAVAAGALGAIPGTFGVAGAVTNIAGRTARTVNTAIGGGYALGEMAGGIISSRG